MLERKDLLLLLLTSQATNRSSLSARPRRARRKQTHPHLSLQDPPLGIWIGLARTWQLAPFNLSVAGTRAGLADRQ
jgi:hypothetical protein